MGSHIKVTFSGQLNGACGRNVGVLAEQMEPVNLERLVSNRETNRTVVAELHVFYAGVEVVEIGRELQFLRPAQRTHQVQFAVCPRMSGHAASHVDAQERIHIKLAKAEVHVCKPVAARLNAAFNIQVRLCEPGLASNPELRALGDRINGEVARALLVEGQVAEVNGRIDPWCVQSAGAGG